MRALRQSFAAIVLDGFPEGSALGVADFATYRNPEVPIIAVTARGFFSDSAIFNGPERSQPVAQPARTEDMAALIQHYSAAGPDLTFRRSGAARVRAVRSSRSPGRPGRCRLD